MDKTKDAEKRPVKKQIHAGHRERMHKRVREQGFESLAEHEALEYILYFANARGDTNTIAHELIERFGDFAGVAEASESELCKVEGIGPVAARLLHLLPEMSRFYMSSRIKPGRVIRDSEQAGSYLMARFAAADSERALLVSLDKSRRVRSASWIKNGVTDRVDVDIKGIVEAAVLGGTNTVLLCHNHPNGVDFPSREDLLATQDITRALGLVKIKLLDHVIVTEKTYFSMRDNNRLPVYSFENGELTWPRGSFTY